jgi:two-component system KDP operon response regulator KdpE
MHKLLIVEDEPAIRKVLRLLLEAESFRVIEADSVAGGEVAARSGKADLLLVDLRLPDGDGLKLIRQIRSWSPVPILVISAHTREDHKIAALDAGADDYVTKPFSAPDLLARVRAALRRSARGSDQVPVLQLGEWTVDLTRRETRATNGEEQHLTPLEYRMLDCLARQCGLIVTQKQLLREVWGPERLGDTRRLRVGIKQLRAKLEPDPYHPQYLVTEVGVGYRLHTHA